jgi:DNA-binding MarR family transcriptional regulator
MSIDALVANAGRLRIMAALAGSGRQEFVALRQSTRLTDGNLASHARRLHTAGFIQIDKQFRAGKPVTSFTLTPQGRRALESHVRHLMIAIGANGTIAETSRNADEEWVD